MIKTTLFFISLAVVSVISYTKYSELLWLVQRVCTRKTIKMASFDSISLPGGKKLKVYTVIIFFIALLEVFIGSCVIDCCRRCCTCLPECLYRSFCCYVGMKEEEKELHALDEAVNGKFGDALADYTTSRIDAEEEACTNICEIIIPCLYKTVSCFFSDGCEDKDGEKEGCLCCFLGCVFGCCEDNNTN